MAEYYRFTGEQIEREPEVMISAGIQAVRRIFAGQVDQDVPAVFVSSMTEENAIVTDIFALRDENFVNLTAEGASGTSAQPVRNYFVYATDIDSDGIVELPQPRQLPRYDDGTSSEDVYWIIDWYRLFIDGDREKKMTTYHNYSGGWFVILPDDWEGQITITYSEVEPGIRGFTFSQWQGYNDPPIPIFTIYAFSGEDRNEDAAADGRLILKEKGDVTYAASFGSSAWARDLSENDLIEMFNFIHIDWNSGEV